MHGYFLRAACTAVALLPLPALAQQHADHAAHAGSPTTGEQNMHDMHGEHAGHAMATPAPMQSMDTHPMDAMRDSDAATHAPSPAPFAEGSGTARLPGVEGTMQGLHTMAGDWMLMLHGYVQATYTDQPGPRGDSMAFVGSMAMVGAERRFAGGTRVQLRSMLSLEPLMSARGYPNVLATGETANGAALVDRQHPHDLFMELAARVDVPLGGGATAFVYGGPVAEPALGPSAFMHRGSARDLPLAPITHHWFDSTHITYGVVTAGIGTDRFQIEVSAFRGREPDEERWGIETPALDSWSVRASWTPAPQWAAQISHGRLHRPEELHPGEDEARTTASVQYAHGGLSAMLAWSAKNRVPGPVLTAWLGEANWDFAPRDSVFARVENVANDELFPDHADPRHDIAWRVTRVEAGYAHYVPVAGPFGIRFGASALWWDVPAAIADVYRDGRIGWTGFVRLTLGA